VDTLTGAECWHYEFREKKWESFKKQNSYSAMAHAMKEEIGNLAGLRQAEAEKEDVRWLQESLNKILKTQLSVDGITGEKTLEAVKAFQRKYGLQVDGVAGPITKGKIREILSV
jgi:peptidoglycan hydrolase-like protein with peptidoglycan-binding domain